MGRAGAWTGGCARRRPGRVRPGIALRGARVWVLGLTFKENVPDFRNTKAVDVIEHLAGYGVEVAVWEPLADPARIRETFGLATMDYDAAQDVDAVIIVNGHDRFKQIDLADLKEKMRTPIMVDVRSFVSRDAAESAGFTYTSL